MFLKKSLCDELLLKRVFKINSVHMLCMNSIILITTNYKTITIIYLDLYLGYV